MDAQMHSLPYVHILQDMIILRMFEDALDAKIYDKLHQTGHWILNS